MHDSLGLWEFSSWVNGFSPSLVSSGENSYGNSYYYQLNSSTIDELGEGAWKDSGASSIRARRVG